MLAGWISKTFCDSDLPVWKAGFNKSGKCSENTCGITLLFDEIPN